MQVSSHEKKKQKQPFVVCLRGYYCSRMSLLVVLVVAEVLVFNRFLKRCYAICSRISLSASKSYEEVRKADGGQFLRPFAFI